MPMCNGIMMHWHLCQFSLLCLVPSTCFGKAASRSIQKHLCHSDLPGVLLRKPLYSAGASLIEKGLSRLQRKASTQPALAGCPFLEQLGNLQWLLVMETTEKVSARISARQEKHTKTIETSVAKNRQAATLHSITTSDLCLYIKSKRLDGQSGQWDTE